MLNYSANGPSGYNLTNSLRFRSSASAFLSRTFATTGTNNKIQTFSAWVKRGLLSSSANYRLMGCYNGSANWSTEINFSNDSFRIEFGGSVQYELKTTQVFRDPSAWYHIVIAIDTTQATASNRIKMYINGTQVTAFSTANYPAQNDSSQLASANANNKIGANWNTPGAAEYFDGYMAEINFIDGQALTPSSFGSTNAITGVWQPAKYTGTYGTNGFYLNFTDIALTSGSNTGLGRDFSGNGNYWNTNNISVTSGSTYDAMSDVPTLTSATTANYCTMNPLESFTNPVPQQANLYIPGTEYSQIKGTMWVSTGKWYFEWISSGGSLPPYVGISNASITSWSNVTTSGISWYGHTDSYYKNFTATSLVTTSSISIGDVIGVAFDCDAGTVAYYKNNSLVHTDTTLTPNELVVPTLIATFSGGGWSNVAINFGQRPFTYTPPSGFKALNTFNLPTSAIVKGNTVMDATLYTGNGTSQTITTASSFKPDLVWIKGRSYADFHTWFDTTRGATQSLSSNLTTAEVTRSTALTAFTSTGFTVGSDTLVNFNANTLVAWNWKANGGTTSSNTSGSITSTVQANTTAGFSIVTYTGTGANATVGHGLGVAPKMIIVKGRSIAESWRVGHNSVNGGSSPWNYYMALNLTNAAAAASTVWNNTAPTSSVFSIGTDSAMNSNTNTYVAYCFAEIAGFSRFGSYTGNGSTNGPFIFTGFRPKFMMMKRTDSTGDWYMVDSSRATYNQIGPGLNPNTSSAEFTLNSPTGGALDFLSNGFKWRGTYIDMNANGGTYIYMAFAENPFKNALAR